MTRTLALALAVLAAPALAQQTEEEARAYAVVLPMLREVVQGGDAEIVAACAVATATPAERAALAAAPGPSADLAPVVNAALARPALAACVRATKGG